MTADIDNIRIIKRKGTPVFVVIPYGEYLALMGCNDITLPPEVVKMNIEGDSMVKAWRTYKKVSQRKLATRIGVTQSAIAQIENSKKPRKNTLRKIAKALGVKLEQLTYKRS